MALIIAERLMLFLLADWFRAVDRQAGNYVAAERKKHAARCRFEFNSSRRIWTKCNFRIAENPGRSYRFS